MQQFDSVIQYNAIILSVLLKEYYFNYLQFMMRTAISSVMLTTRLTTVRQ